MVVGGYIKYGLKKEKRQQNFKIELNIMSGYTLSKKKHKIPIINIKIAIPNIPKSIYGKNKIE